MRPLYQGGLLILLMLYCTTATAQINEWEPGTLVTWANSDTIHGYIKQTDAVAKAHRIVFKQEKTPEAEEYSPANIEFYQIGKNEKYQAYQLKKADFDIDTSRRVFLRFLVDGPANLFVYYPDFAEPHFYLGKEDDKAFYPLRQTSKKLFQNERAYTHVRKEYLGIMNIVFKDCPSFEADENKIKFKQSSLVKAVQAYNKCVDSTYESTDLNQPLISADWGIRIGGGSHTLRYGYTSDGSTIVEKYKRYSPFVSLFGEFSITSSHPQYSVITELSYQKKGNRKGDVIWFELPYIGLSVLPKYTFSQSKYSPYIAAGFTGGYLLNKNSLPYKKRVPETRDIYTELNTFWSNERYFEAGFLGELGMHIILNTNHSATISIRGERTLIPLNYTQWTFHNLSLSMVLGFQID